MVFSLIGLSVRLSSQLRCKSCKLGIGKDSSRPNSFLSNKNWRMCSALIEHILQFLYTIVIENLCLSVLPSKTLLLTPCVHLLLCLQNLCFCLKPMLLLLCVRMLLCLYPCSSVLYKSLTPSGGEAVYHESERTKLIH